jgi:hypothetical protein
VSVVSQVVVMEDIVKLDVSQVVVIEDTVRLDVSQVVVIDDSVLQVVTLVVEHSVEVEDILDVSQVNVMLVDE